MHLYVGKRNISYLPRMKRQLFCLPRDYSYNDFNARRSLKSAWVTPQTLSFRLDSHFSNQVTTSGVERFHDTSHYEWKSIPTTVPTHLDKRSFSADVIQRLCQALIVLADILVLKER